MIYKVKLEWYDTDYPYSRILCDREVLFQDKGEAEKFKKECEDKKRYNSVELKEAEVR